MAATINFTTTGTNPGAATATTVDTQLSQTEFQNLLLNQVPTTEFFNRDIGVKGAISSGYSLTVTGNSKITGDLLVEGTLTSTEGNSVQLAQPELEWANPSDAAQPWYTDAGESNYLHLRPRANGYIMSTSGQQANKAPTAVGGDGTGTVTTITGGFENARLGWLSGIQKGAIDATKIWVTLTGTGATNFQVGETLTQATTNATGVIEAFDVSYMTSTIVVAKLGTLTGTWDGYAGSAVYVTGSVNNTSSTIYSRSKSPVYKTGASGNGNSDVYHMQHDVYRGICSFNTQLAVALGATGGTGGSSSTYIEVTTLDNVPSATSGYIGGETISWTGIDSSTSPKRLTGITRGVSSTAYAHNIGESITTATSATTAILEGSTFGHVAVAIKGNDTGDGFHVLRSTNNVDGAGSYEGVGVQPSSFDTPYSLIKADGNGVHINEHGHAGLDFRVESDTNEHMLFVDSSSNTVLIGSSVSTKALGANAATQLGVYELIVRGNQRIHGDDAVNGTELYIHDSNATGSANVVTNGYAASYTAECTDGAGTAEIWLRDSSLTAANAFNIELTGTGTTIQSYDFNGSTNANAKTMMSFDHATGNVGIGGAAVTSVALAVTSTTSAFMPPRMTTTQRDAITSAAAGMVVYNSTTNVLNFYNGSAWGAV